MPDQDAPLALVVEDETLLGLLVEHVLAAKGFRILHASTKAEAAQHAETACLDLAIVNLWLHGELAGQQVIRELRSRFPRLPVVVISGFSFDSPEANLRGLGGPTVRLGKPEGYSAMASTVRAIMDRARAGDADIPRRRLTDAGA